MTFLDVQVKQRTATVNAGVTAWARSATYNTGHWIVNRPVNVLHYQAALVLRSTGWVVYSLVGEFVPGQGP